MQHLGGKGTRHKLIVHALVDKLLALILGIALGANANCGPGVAEHRVDLVEREPIGHVLAKLTKADLAEAQEEVDDLALAPPIVVICQIERHLVVMKRHKRLDTRIFHSAEQIAVVVDTGLERLLLCPRGEQTGPLDRYAQRLEAHLLEKRNVLLVVMKEVDAVTLGIHVGIGRGLGLLDLFIGNPVQRRVVLFVDLGLIGGAVGNRKTLAIHIPSTLALVGGSGTAPQKAFGEHVAHSYLLS